VSREIDYDDAKAALVERLVARGLL
jgi:hypothetical protein